jgi:hypothetical protein
MGTRRFAHAALLAGGLASCQLAPPRAHNLQELHHPDGSPKRDARLLSDITWMFERGLRSTNYSGELPVTAGQAKRVKDPLGKCLDNVCALARCARDEKVAGLQAATFAWLGVECTNPLSRERSLLALGELAPLLPMEEPALDPSVSAASPEDVKEAFEALVVATREAVAAPALAGNALQEAAARASALNLDRAGAVRLLRAVNALLAESEHGAVRAPLRKLRLVLARRATELAVRAALADSHGRVRAAALEAALRTFPAERAHWLRWGLTDPMEGLVDREAVRLRAIELLAAYGLPPVPDGEDAQAFEEGVRSALHEVLVSGEGGPSAVAACRALARIEDAPLTLRPEFWLARRAHRGAARETFPTP